MVLRRFSPELIPFSIDEAALRFELPSADAAGEKAAQVQTALRAELSLPASIGVATTRAVAKIATDRAKPGGILVVPSGTEAEFLAPLPVPSDPRGRTEDRGAVPGGRRHDDRGTRRATSVGASSQGRSVRPRMDRPRPRRGARPGRDRKRAALPVNGPDVRPRRDALGGDRTHRPRACDRPRPRARRGRAPVRHGRGGVPLGRFRALAAKSVLERLPRGSGIDLHHRCSGSAGSCGRESARGGGARSAPFR